MMTAHAPSRYEAERRNQEREGQRLARSERSEQRPTLSVKNPASAGRKPGQQRAGHEAFLSHLQASGTLIKVTYLDDIETITGRIHATDKYTITLAIDRVRGVPSMGYDKEVIFKHAIRSFRPLPNVPEVSEGNAAAAKVEATEAVEA
ncbi:hypothetical protein D9M69_555640 [compost metagenome]